jgi:hypothetical protein
LDSYGGFDVRICAMRAGKSLSVSSADTRWLKAVVQDGNTPQKHVWRAEIVLLTADGVGTNGIMRRTDKSKTCVWRWQERFIDEGFDGLPPTRRVPRGSRRWAPRRPSASPWEPPGETTHWTSALMAKAAGLSVADLQAAINRFLEEHNQKSQPFRGRRVRAPARAM